MSLFSVSPEMAFQKHSHKTAIASGDTSFPKERKCPSFGRLRILGYVSLRGDHPLQRAQSVPSFSPLSSPLCILPSLGPKWRHCRPKCSTEPVQRLSCTDSSATGNGWWASNRKRTYIRATSREAMCCSFNLFHWWGEDHKPLILPTNSFVERKQNQSFQLSHVVVATHWSDSFPTIHYHTQYVCASVCSDSFYMLCGHKSVYTNRFLFTQSHWRDPASFWRQKKPVDYCKSFDFRLKTWFKVKLRLKIS